MKTTIPEQKPPPQLAERIEKLKKAGLLNDPKFKKSFIGAMFSARSKTR